MGLGISHTDKVLPVSAVKEDKEDMEKMSVKPDTICTKTRCLIHAATRLPYTVKLPQYA
jgi:hypothetical protein